MPHLVLNHAEKEVTPGMKTTLIAFYGNPHCFLMPTGYHRGSTPYEPSYFIHHQVSLFLKITHNSDNMVNTANSFAPSMKKIAFILSQKLQQCTKMLYTVSMTLTTLISKCHLIVCNVICRIQHISQSVAYFK